MISDYLPSEDVFRRNADLVNGFWTGHEFGQKSGAALTLLPAAASAMVRRFVEQSNACCSIPLPLWMETA